MAKGAQTIYKNAYGNTPLKVAIGEKAASWIRRIGDGGEPERLVLAEELKASREEERRKAEEAQLAVKSK